MPGRNEAVFVANLDSRRTIALAGRAHRLLDARGVRIVASHVARDGAGAARIVRDAIAGGAKLVIVGGGDGTQTLAVAEFARRDAVLGVLPFGTGNSFALSLGIEADLERAVDVIARGEVAKVDLGLVNGTYFANFATIGLASNVARATPHALKAALGPAAYAISGVAPFLASRAFRCTVAWPQGRTKFRTHEILVASGRCFGKQPLLPRATIVDGELAFFASTGTSLLDVARSYLALYRGTQTQLADAFYFSAPELSIVTKGKQKLDIDGAKLGKTPAHFSIDRRALRVLVPDAFDEA